VSSSCVDFRRKGSLDLCLSSIVVYCRQIVKALEMLMAMGDTKTSRCQEFRLWVGRFPSRCLYIDNINCVSQDIPYPYAPGLSEARQLAYLGWTIVI
jgi:hypothetical protein